MSEIARPQKKPRAARSPKAPRTQDATEGTDADATAASRPPVAPIPVRVVTDELVIPPKPPLPAATGGDEADVAEAEGESDAEVAVEAEADIAAEVVDAEVVDTEVVDTEVASPAVAEPEPDVAEPDPEVAEEAIAAVFDGTEVEASVDDATAAVVLRGVTKSFGETSAVEGIDLTVPAGTFYGLVGPNGAGKTTTLSMIAGLIQPDRGTIRVGGVDAAADSVAAKRLMGVLPDRLRTFDRLTGRQLLHYYGVLRGLPTAVVEKRTMDLARAFDLSDALGRVVSDYSAGMSKKVMLAGAMIHAPRVLVLDEPFEAVDPVSSAIILDILSAYVAHGGTVILSSHGMELVERVCTRVAVIVAGQVLAEGTVDDVRGELTLEQRFVELAGGLSDVEGLEWLHTFSD